MENQSIKDQVQELVKEREKKCINRYEDKMNELNKMIEMNELKGVNYLRNENIVREKEAENHIMYKMVIDEKTYLEIDGRKYEFLIEFDKKDYSYGIYYGCKCILDESKDILEQIMICEEEWEKLRDYVNMYLTLTFDIDFAERENVSNNANDNTYWPFWYRLGDDEDITVVAALAIKIISNVYRYVLIEKQELEKPSVKTGAERKIEIKSRYDKKSYDDVINKSPDIGILLNKLTDAEYLIKHPILEKCWMINKDNIHIGNFMYVMSIYLNKESILDKWAENVVHNVRRRKALEDLENKINYGEKNKKQQYLLIYNVALKCIYENGEKNGIERSEKDIKKQYEKLDWQKLVEGHFMTSISKENIEQIKKTIKDILKLDLEDKKLERLKTAELKEILKKETIDVTKLGVSSIDDLINQLLDSNDMLKLKTKWKNLVYFLISHSGIPVDRHLPKEVDRKEVNQIMQVVIDVIVHVENEKTEREKEENNVEIFFIKIVDALTSLNGSVQYFV